MKGRDFKTSDRLPVLMRMLPEEDSPQWEAFNLLGNEDAICPYNEFCLGGPIASKDEVVIQTADLSTCSFAENEITDDCEMDAALPEKEVKDIRSSDSKGNGKPTYEELLKKKERGLVLSVLHRAFEEGCVTRPQMADWLGCNKDAIDNLMNNKYYPKITAEDIKAYQHEMS